MQTTNVVNEVIPKKDKKERLFDDINLSNKRASDETFEEYRERLRLNQKGLRMYLKGRTIWDGKQGTRYGTIS